jgi:hypothetical protein
MDLEQHIEEVIRQTPNISLIDLKTKFPYVDERELRGYLESATQTNEPFVSVPPNENPVVEPVSEQESTPFSQPETTVETTPGPPSAKPKRPNKKTDKQLKPKKPAAKNQKQDVFAYLDQKPDLSIDEIQEVFPEIKSQILKRFLTQWQAEKNPSAPKTETKEKSLSSQVFDYLDQNPDSKISDLRDRFPSAKNNTLNKILFAWRKKRGVKWKDEKDKTPKRVKATAPPQPKTKPESLSSKIFEFLNQNPGSGISHLQAAFPDGKTSTLSVTLSRWRKEQGLTRKGTNKGAPGTSKGVPGATKPAPGESIASLKAVIDKHHKTIESLQAEIEQLTQEPYGSNYLDLLKGLSLSDIKKLALTYLRGIKDLPANLWKVIT